MEAQKKTSIFSKNFVLLYFIMMMTRTFMVSDKGISVALESVGISAALIGSLSTIFGLLAVLGRIFSGPSSTVVRPNECLHSQCFLMQARSSAILYPTFMYMP